MNIKSNNWIEGIFRYYPEFKYLDEIIIPASHDSGCLYLGKIKGSCQIKDLNLNLNLKSISNNYFINIIYRNLIFFLSSYINSVTKN